MEFPHLWPRRPAAGRELADRLGEPTSYCNKSLDDGFGRSAEMGLLALRRILARLQGLLRRIAVGYAAAKTGRAADVSRGGRGCAPCRLRNDAPGTIVSRKLALDIYRLAWPVLIAQLAVIAYAVIDTLMAGRYATDDLAAVGIGASIYFSVFIALMGVLLAVSPIVAQLLGARRYGEIGEQVRQGMWLTLALAILSVFVFRYPEPLLSMSEAPPAVADKVRAYLALAAWGAPAGLAFRLFAGYTTAVSLPRVMMTLNLTGLALKVPLNWVFVFGHLGAPEMGAAGCALSTTLVNWMICIMAWLWCALSPAHRHHAIFARWS